MSTTMQLTHQEDNISKSQDSDDTIIGNPKSQPLNPPKSPSTKSKERHSSSSYHKYKNKEYKHHKDSDPSPSNHKLHSNHRKLNSPSHSRPSHHSLHPRHSTHTSHSRAHHSPHYRHSHHHTHHHSNHHHHHHPSRSRSRNHHHHSKSRSRYTNRSSFNHIHSSSRHPTSIFDSKSILYKIPHLVKLKFAELNKPLNETIPISSTDKSKREKELYVTNLPTGLNPTKIVEILNTALKSIDAATSNQDPIIGAYTAMDKDFTFLQFRSIDDCNNAYKLNGMQILNKPIRIGKPIYSDETSITSQEKDMFPTLSSFEKDLNTKASSSSSIPTNTSTVNTMHYNSNILSSTSYGMNSNINSNMRSNMMQVSTSNMPSTSKLLVSNLPLYLGESEIRTIFKIWGRIKYLDILHDATTKKFNGQCNIEYETEKATQEALHYAMGMKLGDNILYIKRSANINQQSLYNNIASNQLLLPHNGNIMKSNLNNVNNGKQISNANVVIPAISAEEYIKFRENNPSNVLCIKNMVTLDELEGNDDYKEVSYDILEECKHYGKVIQVKIPRPSSEYGMLGVGKVFVEYANRDGASWAKKNMQGTSFRGRTIDVVFHPEESFRKGQYE